MLTYVFKWPFFKTLYDKTIAFSFDISLMGYFLNMTLRVFSEPETEQKIITHKLPRAKDNESWILRKILFPWNKIKASAMFSLNLLEYWSDGITSFRQICLSCWTCLQMGAVHTTVSRWYQKVQPGYKKNMKWFLNRQTHTQCRFGHALSQDWWCSSTKTLRPWSW